MKTVYMDFAAATPMDLGVQKAMEPYFTAEFHNPSATYLAAKKVRQALEQTRAEVAMCLGAKPAEVVFTAGATEANNLAIQGVMRRFPQGEVLVSAIEHESVLEPAALFNCKKIPVDKHGQIILNKLSNLISNKTVLISVGYVNNELGSIQNLRQIAHLVSEIRKKRQKNALPLYFHTDAAQAPNYLDIHVARLGVDMLSLNGGKIYGPKQSGALYIKAGVRLQPIILGGGQELGLRSGTENVAASVGLAAALRQTQVMRKTEAGRLSSLRTLFMSELQKSLSDVIFNGSKGHTAPHIISVTFPGSDNERLMMQLDEAGVQVATGSACSASSEMPSHVLEAIGLTDKEARSTLRFSIGRQTTENDIQHVVNLLPKFLAA